MKINNYYVENTYNDNINRFDTLKKAIEYGLKHKNDFYFSDVLLITIGGYNLTFISKSDTYESLYNRCKEIINTIKKEF